MTSKPPLKSSSVPLPAYQKLLQELESVQSQVKTLQSQKAKILKENKQLRSEISGIILQAKVLQQTLDSLDTKNGFTPSFEINPRRRLLSPPSGNNPARSIVTHPLSKGKTQKVSKPTLNGFLLVALFVGVFVTFGLGGFLYTSSCVKSSR